MLSTGLLIESHKIVSRFVTIYFPKTIKMILVGDLNINVVDNLDYEQNKKVQSFFNLMY